jgi:hypothetical protein
MSNIETESEYRDRVTAQLFPDRLTWFFRIPAMYLTICVMGPLVIWLMGLAGAAPSNVEDAGVIAMTMLSLVGVPLLQRSYGSLIELDFSSVAQLLPGKMSESLFRS